VEALKPPALRQESSKEQTASWPELILMILGNKHLEPGTKPDHTHKQQLVIEKYIQAYKSGKVSFRCPWCGLVGEAERNKNSKNDSENWIISGEIFSEKCTNTKSPE